MIIGINATAAIRQPRTGVEEYVYQLIKHLTMLPESREHRFFLFVPSFEKGGLGRILKKKKISPSLSFTKREDNIFDFSIPNNFEIKILKWPLPFFWTQIRLAWEMRRRPPEALLVPVHILPVFHPKNSTVVIHGLEYEYFPKYYPLLRRLYLRWSTKFALKHARKIIAISQNTKEDLVELYGGDPRKIEVVHHGFSSVIPARFAESRRAKAGIHESGLRIKRGMPFFEKLYLLCLGRLEQKKNIEGILDACKILKEKYDISHQLVLAGVPGYGYKKIKDRINQINSHSELGSGSQETPKQIQHDDKREGNLVIELGYVSPDEKWRLFVNADVFLFLSFYEGFGLPVLEAQAADVPVVASFNSCLPEVAGRGALFVNPESPAQIAQAVKSLIDDKSLRDKLIESGRQNLKRFSWEKCARETLKIISG